MPPDDEVEDELGMPPELDDDGVEPPELELEVDVEVLEPPEVEVWPPEVDVEL